MTGQFYDPRYWLLQEISATIRLCCKEILLWFNPGGQLNPTQPLIHTPRSGIGERIRRVKARKWGLPFYSKNRPHSKMETSCMQQQLSKSSLEAESDRTKLQQATHGQTKLFVKSFCFFAVSLEVSFPPHSHTPHCGLKKVRKDTLIKLPAFPTASLKL